MSCRRSSESIQELVDGTLGADPRGGAPPAPRRVRVVPRARTRICSGSATSAATLEPLEPPDARLDADRRPAAPGRARARSDRRPVGSARRARRSLAGDRRRAGPRRRALALSRDLAQRGHPGTPATTAAGNAPAVDAVQSGVEDLQTGRAAAPERRRQAAGRAGHRRAGAAGGGRVDARHNLQILDQAIADSSAALQQEPQNVAARTSLFDALQRKISLLQDTITLMNEMRKGNAAGVAQVVEGVNKS